MVFVCCLELFGCPSSFHFQDSAKALCNVLMAVTSLTKPLEEADPVCVAAMKVFSVHPGLVNENSQCVYMTPQEKRITVLVRL